MTINVSGISIEVTRKNIKNLHLYVKPPYGKVVISAPKNMSYKTIETFAKSKEMWIKEQVLKFEKQTSNKMKEYATGEKLYIWGNEYTLEYRGNQNKNSFEIEGEKVVLKMKGEMPFEKKDMFVREQYRILLKNEIKKILPVWEETTGLYCDSWHAKYMKTRWGTCNSNKKRLWFNVQLAQKNIKCLEYVVLHELIHIAVRNHGVEFVNLMDKHMPNWRNIQKELNS